MTSSDTTTVTGPYHQPGAAQQRARGASPHAVAAVTGSVPAIVSVTAVVVTQGHTRYLPHTLDAVRSQTAVPDTVVVVDVAASQAMSEYQELQLGGARFLAAPHARTFGQAVDIALASRGAQDPPTWIWLLHDDSTPEPGALAELLRAVEHSNAVAIAGAKQRRWDLDGDSDGLLLEVGFTVSPLGRRMTGIDEHEIDQGQHDAREDVFAVGLAGALVRTSVWQALEGTDPEYGVFGDGLDLCRRARLAGHRVVVVPRAVVRHAQASLLDLRDEGRHEDDDEPRVPDVEASYGPRRRSHLHYRLVSVAWPMLVPAVIAMILWAPFQAMYRLAMKRPGQARDELLAPLWAVVRLPALARSRRSVRRTSVLPRRALTPLQGTWRDVLGERRDHRLANAEEHRVSTAPTDLERAELRAIGRRRRSMLGLLTLGLLALTAVVFGSVFGTLAAGGRFVGGELLPADGSFAAIWQAATGGWVADGLGSPAPADPFTTFLFPLALLGGGSLQPAVGVMVVLSFVVAGLGAWFAAGGVTRSVWLRAWAAIVWVAAPSFVLALGEGRLGALVAHAALPWVALGILRALGVQAYDELSPALGPVGGRAQAGRRALRRRRPGSVGAAAAAGLALLVAVCGAPILLPVFVLALGIVAVAARQHRRYLLLVLLPSLVLLAPFWYHVGTTWTDGGWRLLATGPGVPVGSDAAPAWQQLLGLPVEGAPWFGLDGGVLGEVARFAPLATGALVATLAVLALFRARVAGVACAWFVAALGLAAAVVTGAVEVAVSADGPVRGWPGAGVSVVVLGLLGAALLGAPGLRHGRQVDPVAADAPAGAGAAETQGDPTAGTTGARQPVEKHPRRKARRDRALAGWRAGGVGLLALVAVLVPVVSVTSWTLTATDQDGAVGDLAVVTEPVVPKVGQQMQDSEREVRVLSLELAPGGVLEYALLRGDGPQMIDASSVVQARAMADPSYAQGDLPTVVAGMATGSAAGAARELGDLGVGAVVLPTSTTEDAVAERERAELVARLDMVPGLERVTEGQTSVLWRVALGPLETDAPAWARVVETLPVADPDATAEPVVVERLLPTDDKSVATRVDAGGAERAIVLAETADPGWTATLDGRVLERTEVDGRQAFLLGADEGALSIGFVPEHRLPWLAVAGLTLLIFVLLAVPVGRRRTGTR
ncbi:glycosyltransferase [Oerskovia sp. KBS0722]|uniref:glycosyltransferase n=1 Tax=Oerskovia sp. KBS0722 TaxID=1179673 RepID=UPI00110DF5AC|nr:glycosyltransferase [Oerskovia sp. KBS0722]QDW64148.1 glycosyltransferase family 2 protein [Oerskovia sp. KBS0722]